MIENNRYFINFVEVDPATGTTAPLTRYRMGQFEGNGLPYEIWEEPISNVPFSTTTLVEWTGVDEGDEITDLMASTRVIVGIDICRRCGSPDEIEGGLCENCAEAEWERRVQGQA